MARRNPGQQNKGTAPATIYIQVGELARGMVIPQSASEEEILKMPPEKLAEVAKAAQVAGGTFTDIFKTAVNKPSEIQIEFGMSVGGEAGIPFITKGTIEANFSVSITWKNE